MLDYVGNEPEAVGDMRGNPVSLAVCQTFGGWSRVYDTQQMRMRARLGTPPALLMQPARSCAVLISREAA